MNKKGNRSVRRTRTALARSFIALAQEKPVRSITVGELTEAADVSRSTFYTHFHDVFELQEAIGEELLEESEARFRETLSARTPAPDDPAESPILLAICNYIYENAEAYALMLGEHGDAAFQHNLEEYIRRDCLESMADLYGEMPKRYREDFGIFVASGCIGLTKAWLAEEVPTPPERMAKRFGLMIKGAARFLVEQ